MQLGRMLVEAAHRLNLQTVILDSPNSPAKQINALHAHVDGSFADAESIRTLAQQCDVLTYEIEHIDTKVLEELDGTVEVDLLYPCVHIYATTSQEMLMWWANSFSHPGRQCA